MIRFPIIIRTFFDIFVRLRNKPEYLLSYFTFAREAPNDVQLI